MLDAKELYEREKQTQNIVIREIQEQQSNNALSLAGNITKLFEDCFAMCDVMIYGAHHVGWKRPKVEPCQAIVCSLR